MRLTILTPIQQSFRAVRLLVQSDRFREVTTVTYRILYSIFYITYIETPKILRNPRDAECVECKRMFRTELPEWGTDICEDCIQSMTSQRSSSHEVALIEPKITTPIFNPVSLLPEDDDHINPDPGANTILPDNETTIPNAPEIDILNASPAMRCCCGCRAETSGFHHYCSVTGVRVTNSFLDSY